MSETVFPINIPDKVDSPELLAYIASFGEKYFASAEDFNLFKNALNELDDRLKSNSNVELDTILSQLNLPKNDFLINGAIFWQQAFTYYVYADKFILNNLLYTEKIETIITLEASDTELDRIDLFYISLLENIPTLAVKTGVPSANPVKPTLNDGEIEISFVLVKAATIEPNAVSKINVYTDNTEFTTLSSTPTINADDTINIINGTKSISFINPDNTGSIKFISPEPINFDAATLLNFKINLLSNWIKGTYPTMLQISLFKGNVRVAQPYPIFYKWTFGINFNKLNEVQEVVFPFEKFTLDNTFTEFDTILFRVYTGTTQQFIIDDVVLNLGQEIIPAVYEITSNKQNSLGVDGSGKKYPTVDAVNEALSKKVTSVPGKQLTTEDFTTELKDKLINLSGKSVENRYPDIPALLADQANQTTGNFQSVVDASADPTVANGYAYYEYLGTTLGTLADYRKLSEEESMDLIQLELGETEFTAHRGDHGKTAYDHSQTAHAPSNAQKNSDITKAEIEAKLTGDTTSHNHLIQINPQTGTTYTFVIADTGKRVTIDNAGAITLTVPTNASVAFPIGTKIEVTQIGVGVVTISGAGVIFISNLPTAMVQHETRVFTKIDTNTWTVESSGDMSLNAPQTVGALKTFLNNMFGMRNVANTFTSYFTNTNTASRTYTLPNRSGTLADNTDLATKQNLFIGIANYIAKSLDATTLVVSRLFDNGTFFGIGTVFTPTKDITLGNQANREIGIEESASSAQGKILTISAGKTINYQITTEFLGINQSFGAKATTIDPTNGDVWTAPHSGNLYRKLVNSDIFEVQAITTPNYPADGNSFAISYNQNMYICSGGKLWKRTGMAGSFVDTGQVGDFVAVSPTNDIWVARNGVGIYKQTNEQNAFVLIESSGFTFYGIAVAPNGTIYVSSSSGYVDKLVNGVSPLVNHVAVGTARYSLAITPNNNLYIKHYNSVLFQVNCSGSLIQLLDSTKVQTWSPGSLTACLNGDVYFFNSSIGHLLQNNQTTGLPDLDGGTLKLKAGTGKGTGKSRVEFVTGQKTVSGTDMQIETVREYIDENGFHVYTSMPVYADNASALAGGLVVGTKYRTATGDLKIVY